MSELARVEAASRGMVLLRGAMDDLSAPLGAAGLSVPDRRRFAEAGDAAVAWMAPDEAMVLCGPGEAAGLAGAMQAAAEGFVTVVDVSDARVVLDVIGPGATDVLAKLTPADLLAVAPGEMRRSRLAQVPAAFWRVDGGWRVMAFRSVARYVEDLLRNAAAGPPLRPEDRPPEDQPS